MKSKSPSKQKGTRCEPQPGKRVSRLQPEAGLPLTRKPKTKDLKKAGGAT